MHIEIPHKFTQADAVRRIKEALEEQRPRLTQFGSLDKEEWDENTLHFAAALQGKKITGQLQVQENQYVLDATLPLMWRMFEGRIEKAIEENAQKML